MLSSFEMNKKKNEQIEDRREEGRENKKLVECAEFDVVVTHIADKREEGNLKFSDYLITI